MRPKFANLATPASGFVATGVGTAVDVAGYDVPVGVAIGGTFVGTLQVEISCDGGATWVPFGSALTAPGTVKIDIPVQQVRANCKAWTSGAILVALGAVDTNTADEV